MARQARSGGGGERAGCLPVFGWVFIIAAFGNWLMAGDGKKTVDKDPPPVERALEETVKAPDRLQIVQPDKTATSGVSRSERLDLSTTDNRPEPVSRQFVSGSRVALREGPGTDTPVLDRYDRGRAVEVLKIGPEWTWVRDTVTYRTGYIASRFLSLALPAGPSPRPASSPPAKAKPGMSDNQIAEAIIARSVASYGGRCPCPWNTDRAGRRCGKRSAYSRPGGAAPLCFREDVTAGMIEKFRRSQ